MEQEIQARVDFKLNEIFDAVRNAIKRNRMFSFMSALESNDYQLSQKQHHYKEAYEEFNNILIKESAMSLPCDDMYRIKQDEARNSIVEEVMEDLKNRTRGKLHPDQLYHFQKVLINSIEKNRV